MEAFLIRLGTMSIQAAVVIAVVLFLRYLFAKLHVPKKYVMLLWMVPYICMICPWKISLPFSFWGSDDKVFSGVSHVAEQTEMLLHVDPAAQFSVEMMNPAQQVISEDVRIGQNTTGTLGSMAASEFLYISLFLVWLFGVLLLTGYSIYSYRKLKKRILCSIWMEENIYYADDIETAFVMGFLKQVIYLPSNMKKEHASYVIAHETTHIKRHDPLKKLAALTITCIHWFNPLAWVAFTFLNTDMEMTCDEETVARLGMESKVEYANALLQLSAPKGMLFHAPLAFGEGNTKGRIQNILKYKKAVWGVTALALVLIVVVAAGFLGKTYAVTTLGSGDVEQVAFPANRNVEVALLHGEGLETKFVVFPEAYGEIFIDFLENVKVERNPISKSRAEDRPSELMIRIGESDCFCFDADATEVWYDDGVKPSYSYRVVDSEELLEFINRQIQSITEAEEAPVLESEKTDFGDNMAVSITKVYRDHSLYETYSVDKYFTLANSYEANVNHTEDKNGLTDEVLEVYTGNTGDGDSGMVLVKSKDANEPYSIEAHTSRVGWLNIYLLEGEEKDYLFDLDFEIREGFGNLSYMVYYFEDLAGPKSAAVVADEMSYTYEAGTFDEKAFFAWAYKMESYLADAKLLLSTQDGVLRVGPANDSKRYTAENIRTEIEESMEGIPSWKNRKVRTISYGHPAIPYYEADDEESDIAIDATETSLDYADENIVVFHNYLGLFIYDWIGQKMLDSVALELIGCNYTQGDNYCEVLVDGAGKTIYLHPLQEKEMYVYDLTTATLTKQEYNIEGIELFNDFGEKEKQLGWDPTVFQTINCVQVGEHRWIHLESGSGLLQDLAVVVTKDGKREAYLKVFGELVGE